jgi:hypothetical protein
MTCYGYSCKSFVLGRGEGGTFEQWIRLFRKFSENHNYFVVGESFAFRVTQNAVQLPHLSGCDEAVVAVTRKPALFSRLLLKLLIRC